MRPPTISLLPLLLLLLLLPPPFTSALPLLNTQLNLIQVNNTACEQITNPLLTSAAFPQQYQTITPVVKSVRPNATSGVSVVLEVALSNAKSLLASGTDLLIIWTADDPSSSTTTSATATAAAPTSFGSQRFTVLAPPTNDTFTVLIDFKPNNNTAALIPPLWQRVTYFYVRLLAPPSTLPHCEFASMASPQHTGWPAPCGSGEYLKVLGTPWFNFQQPVITVDHFLDFSYRPLRSDDNTVTCLPCGLGLDCSQSSSTLQTNANNSRASLVKLPAVGFHGGVVVDQGFWRVDWASDASTVAARCRNTNACGRGGRCTSALKTGPLCEVCHIGYGARAGTCVACDHQDLVPLAIVGGLIILVLAFAIIFRKTINELRAVWWSIGRILKVIIDCAQIVSAMPSVLGDIYWPDELRGLFAILDLASLDITQYIGLACVDGKETSYYQKSGMMLIFVLTVTALVFILFRVSIYRKKKWWLTKATAAEKDLFVEEVLEDVFEVADIDDNGKLSFVEAHSVAKRVGNATIESALIEHMFKQRKKRRNKSFDQLITRAKTIDHKNNANDKSNSNKAKKKKKQKSTKRRSSVQIFATGEKRIQQQKDIDDYKKQQQDIYLYHKEFIAFMKTQEGIGDIVLRAERKERVRSVMTFFMPFMLILHTPITARVFALFTCDPVGGSGLRIRSTGVDVYDGAGSMDADDLSQRLTTGFLPADYKLPCMDFSTPGNPIAVLFYVLCFLFLALITVGLPVGLMAYMFVRRHSFYSYKTYSEIGYLYERFHRGSEFCDLHILVYKTLLCAFIVFFQPWPRLQRVMGLSICICYLTWFAWNKPMRNPIVTRVCLYGFCVTSFVYASTQIFADLSTDVEIRLMFVYLIIVAKIGLLGVGCVAIFLCIKMARKTLRDTLAEKALHVSTEGFDVGSEVVALGASGFRYPGKVRYIGELPGKVGEFIGLELEGPRGKNDGRGLFLCKPKHGLFVKRKQVVEIVQQRRKSNAAKSRADKQSKMRLLSSTVVNAFDAKQLSKMSQSMMEKEISRLQKQALNQREEISRLNGILGL